MYVRTQSRLIVLIGMAIVAFVVTVPFYWLAMSSVKPSADLFTVDIIPNSITLANYRNLLQGTQVLRFFLNSVLVAVTVTLITILVAVLGAYSLVFFRYPGRDLFSRLILFTYMFPAVVIIVPVHTIMTTLYLSDRLLGVVLVELVLTVPFSVWMLRGFFLDIPKELEEAAIIDGCSKLKALLYVLLPVALPGVIAVAVFAFIFSWNEYLFPLVLINTESSKTLPIGIAGFMGHLSVQWGPLLASGVVSTIPILILFIFLQRYLIHGLTAGAVKG